MTTVPGLLDRIEAAIESAQSLEPGVSERTISTRAGLSSGYLGKTKTELRRNAEYDPGGATLQKLAKAMGVRAEWLASGEEPMVTGGSTTTLRAVRADASGLDGILEGVSWPEDLMPQDAAEVVRQIRQEFLKAAEPIPQSYWHMRIKRLIGEVRRASERVERELKAIDERAKATSVRPMPPTGGAKRSTKGERE